MVKKAPNLNNPAFIHWFSGSTIRDDSGHPLVLYHATDAEFSAFQRTEDIGFHFGPLVTAEKRLRQIGGFSESDDRYSEGAHIMPVFVRMQRPLRLPDLHTWSPTAVLGALVDAGVITRETAFECDWVDRETVAEWLAVKGYDGIVYANHTEGGGDSFIALYPEQIKSIWNSGRFAPGEDLSDLETNDIENSLKHSRTSRCRFDFSNA